MDDASEKPPLEETMAPVFLFVAASLNVELVYCILKGITKFGYLTLTGLDQVVINQKLAKLHVD